ncbi:MAG: PAS domain S-box protein [Desulfobacterales bacterium]|nr:PAS domain S-box protein [Desulfobacterales bacterium]
MPKKSTSRTQKQLVAENDDLRARLEEAEETLRAIRSGEVDALIVSGAGGEQIFTLKGADHSYRILIEDMNEGALTLTAEGVILYANRRFAEMLKTSLEKVIGSTIHTWIAPDSQRILQSLLIKGRDEKRREELVLAAGDGTLVPVYLSVSSLPIYETSGSLCLVATDLTEQKRSDAIAASEKLARELLAASNQSRLELLSEIEHRKRAEETLHVSEENFRRHLDESPLGLRVVSKEGETLYANRATLAIFGCDSIEQWQTTPTVKRYTEQSYAEFKVRREKRRLDEDDSSEYEIDIVRKDGEVRHLYVWRTQVLWNGREHYQVRYSDITERKQTEEALARRATELSALNAMAAIVNESASVDEILNRAANEVLQLIKIESAGMLLLDEKAGELALVAHRGLSDEFVRAFSRLKLGEGLAGQAAQTGRPVILEGLEDYPQARRAYVEKEGIQSAVGVPLIGSTGVIGAMSLGTPIPQHFDAASLELLVGLGRQIATGVEKARFYERECKALAAAAAAKSAIDTIEAMGDGLLLHAMDGKITFVNPAFERMTGYEKSELTGTDIVDLVQRKVKPGNLEKTIEDIGSVLEGKAPVLTPRTLVSKDGREVPITFTVSFIRDAKGQPVTAIVTIKDITQIRQAEDRLQEYSKQLEATVAQLRDAREQLVRAEKLAILGQLAGGVAHELRNPLAVMSNAIYYLRNINTEADETTREYLEMISSEVGNAEGIISDLLDFSRTRSSEPEQVTAAELVARVLQKQPPPEKVKVTTGIPPELPPVFVDPRQMGQVLGNLVANAYQTTAEGGHVTITAELIEADPIRDLKSTPEEYASPRRNRLHISRGKHSTGQAIRIRITDTGCGISKENMEKIFEPLFTTRARGIGLGLAVARNLAELNGGRIEVQSEEGQGSTFIVTLPVKAAVSIVDC